MDRGFEIMIPREKETPEKEKPFHWGVSFSLFGKEYILSLRVFNKQRRNK